jgi:ribosomal protein S18 acetylase RimI-like enzyme
MEQFMKTLTLVASLQTVLKRSAPCSGTWPLQPFSSDYTDRLARLYVECYASQHCPDTEEALDEWKRTLGGEYGTIWSEASLLLFDQGRLVGCVVLVREAPYDDVPPGPFAIELMVAPDHQRRGIATCLLHEACRVCVAHGDKTLGLRVLTANSGARELYRKLGFEEFHVVD